MQQFEKLAEVAREVVGREIISFTLRSSLATWSGAQVRGQEETSVQDNRTPSHKKCREECWKELADNQRILHLRTCRSLSCQAAIAAITTREGENLAEVRR